MIGFIYHFVAGERCPVMNEWVHRQKVNERESPWRTKVGIIIAVVSRRSRAAQRTETERRKKEKKQKRSSWRNVCEMNAEDAKTNKIASGNFLLISKLT